MLEYGCNLFQISRGVIHIAWIQLHLKRTPRAIVKLDDGINLSAFIILVMDELGIQGLGGLALAGATT